MPTGVLIGLVVGAILLAFVPLILILTRKGPDGIKLLLTLPEIGTKGLYLTAGMEHSGWKGAVVLGAGLVECLSPEEFAKVLEGPGVIQVAGARTRWRRKLAELSAGNVPADGPYDLTKGAWSLLPNGPELARQLAPKLVIPAPGEQPRA